jgi:hypothetical protein
MLENNLRTNGAGADEIAFMFRDFDTLRSTRRVELNAMTSPQFVAYVERKLKENGVAKVIPNRDLLTKVYTGLERGRRLKRAVEKLDKIDMRNVEPPADIEQSVRKMLKKSPWMRWDAAVEAIIDATRKGGRGARAMSTITCGRERRK